MEEKEYSDSVISARRRYIPLLYNQVVQNILSSDGRQRRPTEI
jgi:hypothetical protein